MKFYIFRIFIIEISLHFSLQHNQSTPKSVYDTISLHYTRSTPQSVYTAISLHQNKSRTQSVYTKINLRHDRSHHNQSTPRSVYTKISLWYNQSTVLTIIHFVKSKTAATLLPIKCPLTSYNNTRYVRHKLVIQSITVL